MEDEQFTPPSDAVEVKSKSKFTPPSDAVEVKKKEISQPSGPTPQKVSPTPTATKKSLLVGESPKKPLVSGGSVGENKKKLSSVLQENKIESFTTKKKDIIKQDKEATFGLTKKPSGSLSVAKTKAPISMEDVAELKAIVNDKLYQYRDQTKLSDDEKKDTEQQLNDKINTVGFMNNVVDMFHQATNYFSKGAFIKDDPLQEEKQRAKDYFSDMDIKPSPLDVDNKAKEFFIDDKNTEKKQQKINEFLGGISDDKIKDYLEADAEKRFKSIDKDRNDISNRISLNQKYANTLVDDIQNPNVSPEQKEYKQIELKKIAGYLKSDVDKFNSFDSTKVDSTAEDEFNSFRKNYNALDNVTGRFKSGLIDLGSELVAATGYMGQYSGSPLGTIRNIQSQEAALEMKKSSDLIRDQLRPDNKDITLGNFIQSSTDVLSGAAPSLIVAGATGGAGAGILGIGKAGSTYNEMWEKQMSGKEHYSPAQMAFAPLVSGVSNALLYEIPTFYSLRNAKNVFKAAMREEASSLIMKESIKKSGIELSKNLFKNVGIQVPTAVTDNIVQNAIKRDILGDNSVHYMDGNWGVIKNTGLIAGLISTAPHIGVGIVKMFSKTSDAQILERNGIKIKEYLTQLDDVNLDEKTRGILEKSIDKMTKESSDITNKTINNIAKIDESKIEKVAKNNKRIDEVKTEVKVIKENDNLTTEQKQFELDGLKKETIQIVKENTDIIDEADKTTLRKGRGIKAATKENVFYYKDEVPNEVPEGYTTMKKVENSKEVELLKEQNATETQVATPTEEEAKSIEIDKARDKRWAENNDLAMAEGSTFYEDTSLKKAKIGDEFRFKEYKDGKWNEYNTKVKDIVDGKIVFENGKTQDDISSFMNKTAQDTWFDKNHPELSLQEKPSEEVKPEAEVKTEEPTPTKTRKQPKEKLEEPKAETEKEIVSLPEVINDENFDDIVKKLMDSDKVTKPCD